jgi:hypothetical protein
MSNKVPGLRCTFLNPNYQPHASLNLRADLRDLRGRLDDFRHRSRGYFDDDGEWGEGR